MADPLADLEIVLQQFDRSVDRRKIALRLTLLKTVFRSGLSGRSLVGAMIPGSIEYRPGNQGFARKLQDIAGGKVKRPHCTTRSDASLQLYHISCLQCINLRL